MEKKTATSLVAENDDKEILESLLNQPSGSQDKLRKRWLEFDCQNGVHHGKYTTWENGSRKRIKHLGRFARVQAEGQYATRRIQEFIGNHNCHYPERFKKDLEENGIGGIAIENWPSGRSPSGLPDGARPSGNQASGNNSG